MNKAGGIAYLLKHGRAPMPAVTRTTAPRRGNVSVRGYAEGGIPLVAPQAEVPQANKDLNFDNVPNYVFVPGGVSIDANGRPVYTAGRYEIKGASSAAGSGAGTSSATGSVGVPTGGAYAGNPNAGGPEGHQTSGPYGNGTNKSDAQWAKEKEYNDKYGFWNDVRLAELKGAVPALVSLAMGNPLGFGLGAYQMSKQGDFAGDAALRDISPDSIKAMMRENPGMTMKEAVDRLGMPADGGGSAGPLSGFAWGEKPAPAPAAPAAAPADNGGITQAMREAALREGMQTEGGERPAGGGGPLSGGAWGEGRGGDGNGGADRAADHDRDHGNSGSAPGGGAARGGYAYNGRMRHMATGGIAALAGGGHAQGPRLLSGGGDGLSDGIPAVIGHNQPARLADGEFVVSADVVSALGGGSTKAGAKKLYAMMDRIRKSAHGTKKQVKKVSERKVLPA